MAATADDILTVDEMKTQLRLPASHTSEDAFFQSLINQAIDQVSLDTGRPLIDRKFTTYADIPATNDDPLVIEERDFVFDKSNTEHDIDAWSNSVDLGDAPDTSISRDETGRVVRSNDGSAYYIYLADGEKWPENLNPDTRIRVIGSKVYEVPEGLKSAVIILVRFLYSGKMDWPSNPAYNKLISPYRRVTPMGVRNY